MELSSRVQRSIFKLCFLILTCCCLLWFSLFSYGLLYYLYVPAIAHEKPVYLKYDSTCPKEKFCKHPHDNVTLVEEGKHELLTRGQIYTIELYLEMPESERNLNQGMFMVRLDILSQSGETLTSARRPAMLHHRSSLFKVIHTLFYIPALLAGYVDEKQSLIISLFERYSEYYDFPAHHAFVEIEAQAAEVYSSSLRIHAQFTGLRYMMYYWPVLSAIIIVGFNFFCLATVLAFILVRQFMNTQQYIDLSNLDQSEQDVVNEIRQSVQRNREQRTSNMESKESGIYRRPRRSETTSRTQEIELVSSHTDIESKESGIYRRPRPSETTSRTQENELVSSHAVAGVYKLEEDKPPRARLSAYAFFVKACREEHMKKAPGVPVVFCDFARQCDDQWKAMNDEEKTRFHQMAEVDKKRYLSEMLIYKPEMRKRTLNPNVPKRPLAAFFWFSQDERPRLKEIMPNATFGDVAQKLTLQWSEVSPETRSHYEALAAQDNARYLKELKAHKTAKARKKRDSEEFEEKDDDDDQEDESEEKEEDVHEESSSPENKGDTIMRSVQDHHEVPQEREDCLSDYALSDPEEESPEREADASSHISGASNLPSPSVRRRIVL